MSEEDIDVWTGNLSPAEAQKFRHYERVVGPRNLTEQFERYFLMYKREPRLQGVDAFQALRDTPPVSLTKSDYTASEKEALAESLYPFISGISLHFPDGSRVSCSSRNINEMRPDGTRNGKRTLIVAKI